MPEIKDSGHRQTFGTGAQRDTPEGKGMPSLISTVFLQRLSVHLEKGAIKYEARNWEKGIPLIRFYDGIMRHMWSWLMGMDDEDHLAAAAFGVMGIIHTEEMIRRGVLPESLRDGMPNWEVPYVNIYEHYCRPIMEIVDDE